eukprot:gene6893-21520_t
MYDVRLLRASADSFGCTAPERRRTPIASCAAATGSSSAISGPAVGGSPWLREGDLVGLLDTGARDGVPGTNGDPVGDMVGADDGAVEGGNGDADGALVGDPVSGARDGVPGWNGATEGDAVGATVGTAVGRSVATATSFGAADGAAGGTPVTGAAEGAAVCGGADGLAVMMGGAVGGTNIDGGVDGCAEGALAGGTDGDDDLSKVRESVLRWALQMGSVMVLLRGAPADLATVPWMG